MKLDEDTVTILACEIANMVTFELRDDEIEEIIAILSQKDLVFKPGDSSQSVLVLDKQIGR